MKQLNPRSRLLSQPTLRDNRPISADSALILNCMFVFVLANQNGQHQQSMSRRIFAVLDILVYHTFTRKYVHFAYMIYVLTWLSITYHSLVRKRCDNWSHG